jgi:ABC-type branched-subunit amino acid transport system permease subunit
VNIHRLAGLLRDILAGYLRILKRVGLFLFLLLAAGLAGLLVTYPLWLFATRQRRGYNLFIALTLAALLLLLLALRMRRAIRESGGFPSLVRRRWLPFLRKTGVALFLLALLYLSLLLLSGGLIVAGAAAALLFLLALGYAVRASRR